MYLRVREAGAAPSPPPVLFIHGLGESGLCFEHLLEHQGLMDWRLLSPDLPGFGRSPWPVEPLTLADQADHLAAWLRETVSGRVQVAGHSMGGIVGLLLCERHPDLVASMVDIDGNKTVADCVFSGQAARQDLAGFLAGGFDELRSGVFAAGRTDPAQRGYYVSLRLCDPRSYHLNSGELIRLSTAEDLARRLAALPVPTTYLAGVPGGVSRRSRELLTEAQVNWIGIEPSGHWPFIDRPDDFVAALRRVLLSRPG